MDGGQRVIRKGQIGHIAFLTIVYNNWLNDKNQHISEYQFPK